MPDIIDDVIMGWVFLAAIGLFMLVQG